MELRFSRDLDFDIIPHVLAIDSAVYPPELQGSYESVSARYNKNKDSFILLFDAAKLVGYFCLFPIKKELFTQMCRSRLLFDDNISAENIREYGPRNLLFLISAAIIPEYQHGRAIHLLVNGLRRFLCEKEENGRHIDAIATYTISSGGVRLAQRIGFEKKYSLENGDTFCLCSPDAIRTFIQQEDLS